MRQASGVASLVPPDAPLYLEVALFPDDDRTEAIASLTDRIAGISDPEGQLASLLDAEFAGAGLDVTYTEDIEPWLGDSAAAFVRSFEPSDVAAGMVDAAYLIAVDRRRPRPRSSSTRWRRTPRRTSRRRPTTTSRTSPRPPAAEARWGWSTERSWSARSPGSRRRSTPPPATRSPTPTSSPRRSASSTTMRSPRSGSISEPPSTRPAASGRRGHRRDRRGARGARAAARGAAHRKARGYDRDSGARDIGRRRRWLPRQHRAARADAR